MNASTPIRVVAATAFAACLAATGCATTSPGYGSTYGAPPPVSGACYDCGTVTRIDATGGGSSVPNATGAVLGGIVGAVAGAVVGNAIQNRAQANNGGYTIYVRMDNGTTQAVNQADLGGIREGSYVRVYNGRAWLR